MSPIAKLILNNVYEVNGELEVDMHRIVGIYENEFETFPNAEQQFKMQAALLGVKVK